jgi:hypothetical protein
MPKANPEFLLKMLDRVEAGKEVRGKSGNLTIEQSDNGRYLLVHHFGTMILHLDFHQDENAEKVIYQYGESQTDARYINTILAYYYLANHFDVGYGSVNGWRFNLLDDDGKVLAKDYRHNGAWV